MWSISLPSSMIGKREKRKKKNPQNPQTGTGNDSDTSAEQPPARKKQKPETCRQDEQNMLYPWAALTSDTFPLHTGRTYRITVKHPTHGTHQICGKADTTGGTTSVIIADGTRYVFPPPKPWKIVSAEEEDEPAAPQETDDGECRASNDLLKEYLEFSKGEVITQKRTLCPNLKTPKEVPAQYLAFDIGDWVAQVKANPLLTQATAAALRSEITTIIALNGITPNTNNVGKYPYVQQSLGRTLTAAIKAYVQWVEDSALLPLATKNSWRVGFKEMFDVMSAMMQTAKGTKPAQEMRTSLEDQYDKGYVDAAATFTKYFRFGHSSRPSGRRTFNTQDADQSAPANQGEKRCRFCKKTVPRSLPWSQHKC